jgi:hypothetical protein
LCSAPQSIVFQQSGSSRNLLRSLSETKAAEHYHQQASNVSRNINFMASSHAQAVQVFTSEKDYLISKACELVLGDHDP